MRRAFSMIELVLGMAVASLTMLAIASSLMLSAKALPTARGSTGATTLGSLPAQELLDDLRVATAVSEAAARSVTLTVADRTGDGEAETIRYAWSGVAGQPLTRSINGGAEEVVTAGVYGLALDYSKEATVTNTQVPTAMTSGTVLMAQFAGWSGITSTTATLGVTSATWASEAFTIDRVSLPATVTAVRLTRVDLMMKQGLLSTSGATVTIHPRRAAGAVQPAASAIGVGGTVLPAILGASAGMVPVALVGVTLPDPTVLNYCVVVKGLGIGASCEVVYDTSSSAPVDSTVFQMSANGGSTWTPSTNTNRNDLRFALYGEYDWTASVAQSSTSYALRSATVRLQTGQDSGSASVASVVALNKPPIPGP